MITIHHLEYSQSFRLLWLMEELGEAYDLKIYQRDPKTMLAPADYKTVSPLGTSPVITDGDLNLSESNAIIDYILDKYDDGKLRPKAGSPERTDYLFWFHAAQGSFMPLLTTSVIFDVLKSRSPFIVKPIIKAALGQAEEAFSKPRMKRLIEKAEADLGRNTWFAGERLTAADIVMSYCMEAAQSGGMINASHPNCLRWVDQMKADKGYKIAMEKDGTGSAIFSRG